MNEDKTYQNDEELETNDTEHDNSTTESEGEADENRTYTQAELNERLEAERKERDRRWRERLKKAGGEEDAGQGKGSSKKDGQESNSEEVVSDVTLARLEARGILDADIQNYLITAAKREGKSPVDLLSDSYFTDKIAAMKRDREQEAARPAPSSRTGTTDHSKDLHYWLKQAEKGNLPTDRDMRKKVIQKLSGR